MSKFCVKQLEELQKRIKIEELFEMAISSVTERISWINSLQVEYTEIFKKLYNEKEYKEYLDELYSNSKFRPYACILLYNYYYEHRNGLREKCDSLLQEMTNYIHNNEIIKFLFKHYGHNLHIEDNRSHLFNLSQNHPFLKDNYPLRFHYYNFIAESYNHNFYNGKKELEKIKHRYYSINPEFNFTWCNEEENTEVFDGIIVKRDKKKYKAVKISSLQQTFRLKKGNYDIYKINDEVKVILMFYLYGGELGQGFYLGTALHVAKAWAKQMHDSESVVEFQIDDDDFWDFDIKSLTKIEALEFRVTIRAARQTSTYKFSKDIIWGPIVGGPKVYSDQHKWESSNGEAYLNGNKVLRRKR
jgi:uncharacterized protein YneR